MVMVYGVVVMLATKKASINFCNCSSATENSKRKRGKRSSHGLQQQENATMSAILATALKFRCIS